MNTGYVWHIIREAQPTGLWVIAKDLDEALNHLASLKKDRSQVIFIDRKNEVNYPYEDGRK